MNLQAQAQLELTKYAARGAGPHRLDIGDGPRRITSELTTVDSLACEFTWLTLQTNALAGAATARLQDVARSLARRLTYLLEPISPVETDAEGCTVQLRSNPPQRGDDGTSYYELFVRRGGELDLRRWKKVPGGSRSPLPAAVTREVFLRLVGDFADAVA